MSNKDYNYFMGASEICCDIDILHSSFTKFVKFLISALFFKIDLDIISQKEGSYLIEELKFLIKKVYLMCIII